MALILYILTALALLALAHRFVRPLSKWAAALLLLLPLVLTGYALVASRVLAPVDLPYDHIPLNWMKEQYGIERVSSGIHTDVYLEFIPWRKATQWSLARGEWGLWTPFTFAGEPLLGGEQASVTWPITWIACLLPAALSFTFHAAITLLIAALTAFLFARELGCREAAAMIAAAGWAFASTLVMFLLVAMGVVWAWAPLVFLGVARIATRRGIALLTFAFTALLAAGHPESALYVIFTAMLYGLFELRRANAGRMIGGAVAAGVLALLLSAIHLLPFVEALPHSMEFAHRDRFEDTSIGIPAQHVLARLATNAFPWLYGREWKLSSTAPPSHTNGAAGSIILALAIYAIWRIRSRQTWFFASMAALAMLLGAEWKPLATLIAHIPLFDIALPDRISAAAAFFLVILAALGVEEICRRGGDRAAVVTLAMVAVCIALGNAWLLRAPDISHDQVFFGRYVVVAEIAFLIAAIFCTRRVPLLLGLLIAQRALSVGDVYKSFAQRQAYPPIPILEPLKQARKPFRIAGHGLAFHPATSTMYELEDIRGYSALTMLRLRETYPLWCVEQPVWFNRIDDFTRPFLSFLNVRYVITWDREPPHEGWREVARQRGSVLLENTRALERVFVPRTVRVGGNALEEMRNATDFSERAWIESAGESYERANGPGTLTIREKKLGYVIDANMQSDGWIVTSIAAWPGWRAYVDGKRLQTQIANHAFVSVHVPRGKHRLLLRYWPRGFVIGRAITAGTLLAVIALFLLNRFQPLLQRRDSSLAALPLGE
ncbi:MAG TPA: YfhO family protein [Thermoanaerobaculia bacterium]|nr:YfhO family protein [Thermoanaerobaculia bacterium]